MADEVVIAVATEPTSLDPLYQALGSNHELAKHAFNSIVEPGPKYELEPGLAESWGPTDDPLVWEFKLRKGVTFHNGEPFTAHDAAFTYERTLNVPNAPSTYKRRTAKVAESVVVDDHTLHVRTKTPYPLLPNSLASVPIVSRAIGMAPALSKGVRNNYGRWENEKFNELMQGALSTVDLAEYESKLKAATAVAMHELPIIPTHFQVACWATREGLAYVPRADEYTAAESLVVTQ